MKKENKKIKVLIAMSGGVDSSVAAALLVRVGYDVTGMFAVNFQESCWRGDYQDALRVCAKLGIPLLRWDFTKEYKKMVLDYMYREYKRGNTPNPDVLCNKFVKFGSWLKKARSLGFDYLATGHYARVKQLTSQLKRNGDLLVVNCSLLVSKDTNKDQTYFLHQLTQEQLKYVMFPIGDYTKPEVRALAKKFQLPTAQKEESMGICFVGEVPMKKFLQEKIKPKKGKIILSSHARGGIRGSGRGKAVGEHDGVVFYTIGERIGVNNKLTTNNEQLTKRPVYVVGKNLKKNELIVGYENDPLLYKKEITVGEVNWIGQTPKFPLKCKVRLRHRQPLQKAVIKKAKKQKSKKTVIVEFDQPERAVTPGQFAVLYLKNKCLGGGVII